MERQYKDSGIEWIGRIPEEWKTSIMSTLFYEHCCKNEGLKESNLLSLSFGKIIRKNINENGGLLPESFEGYNIIDANDIVFRLTDLQNDKRSLRTGLCKERGIITSAYTTVRGRNNSIDYRYFHYLFHSCDECKIFYGIGNGVRQSMNFQDLRKLQIVIPPLPEQQSIASYLDKKCGEIDELIALQEKMIAQLTEYKQAVITEAVTKGLDPNAKLVPSGIEWIGDVPEGWKVVPLRYLGRTQNGISQSGDYFGEGYPFVSYSDVYKNYSLPVQVKGLAKSSAKDQELFSVQAGDVFFTRTSETIEEIGFSSVCLTTIDNAVFAGFLIRFRPYKNALINKDFSMYYFRCNIHRAFFVKEMNLVIRASLSQELLKSLPVILPPLPDQQRIATYLDTKCSEIDTLIALKRQKIESLNAYKKSVIYEAVTGKTIIE